MLNGLSPARRGCQSWAVSRSPERRRHLRVSLHIPVICFVGVDRREAAGSLMDLAEGGAAVMITTSVNCGAQAVLTFRVGTTWCRATGRVVRLIPNPEGQGVGLELLDSDLSFLNFVRNLSAASEFEKPQFLRDLREVRLEIY